MYPGIIGYLIGTIIMISIPGNYNRLAMYNYDINQNEFYKIYQFLLYFIDYYTFVFKSMLPYILIFIILLIPGNAIGKTDINNIDKWDWFFWIMLGMSCLSLFIELPPRMLGHIWTFFPPLMLTLTGIVSLTKNAEIKSALIDKLLRYMVYPAFIIFLTFELFSVIDFNKQISARENIIRADKSQGKSDILVPSISSQAPDCIYFIDSNDWQNTGMASYYGVRSIHVTN